MTENKRFQWVYIKDNILELRDNGIVKVFNNERLEELLNALNDENEQLKQQLREEQCRTTPITLTTHISDDDFKKIELMLKKYFGDLE